MHQLISLAAFSSILAEAPRRPRRRDRVTSDLPSLPAGEESSRSEGMRSTKHGEGGDLHPRAEVQDTGIPCSKGVGKTAKNPRAMPQ